MSISRPEYTEGTEGREPRSTRKTRKRKKAKGKNQMAKVKRQKEKGRAQTLSSAKNDGGKEADGSRTVGATGRLPSWHDQRL
ncbi:MAG: hypothetical protein D6679_13305 [Candidatus Hydrogenedentota bacterium]|nr:MAG: hypothetical protein D6679_13305 [Candidatus Hydrogenedentota bacterium]